MQARYFILLMCSVLILCVDTAYGQWTQTGGPNEGNVTVLAVSGTNLYAGTFGGGVFLTTNNGDTWDAVNNGLTDPFINCLAVKGTTLFAGTAGGGVFRTTDNGATWTEQNTDLTNTEVNAIVTYEEFVLAGTNDGAFLSTNNGDSWIATNTGLENRSISSLVRVNDVLLAGTLVGVFRYDTQTPGPWTKVSSGITSFAITALSVAGTYVFAATSEDIFLSKNKGNTWATAGLPSTTFVSSVIAGSDFGDANYFVGTVGDGVFRTNGNAVTWIDISTGLSNVDVRALAISGTDLIAGTSGSGAWRRPLSEIITSVVEDRDLSNIPQPSVLAQNYPNPANDIATIRFRVSGEGAVLLDVFDALNNSVAVLVNERMQSGSYIVTFATHELPSGVYYYRIQTANVVETKRLVVMR